MKYTTIFLLLFSTVFFSYGQTQEDSVGYYINNLNSSSVDVSTTYFPMLLLDRNCNILISLKNNNLLSDLLKEIDNKEKTLAIHVILTRRLNIYASLKEFYDYKNNVIVRVNYSYNGLHWYRDSGSNEYFITNDSVKKIKQYWKEKTEKESGYYPPPGSTNRSLPQQSP